jgi:glucose-1-phosphate thymidylyltransferase
MKGIVLAGGTGSRLHPVTKVINKHLLPIFDKPMIYYPLDTLVKAGINEIVLVSGSEHIDQFKKLLTANGDYKKISFNFVAQAQAGGNAQALAACKKYVGDDKLVVILGDNLIEDDIGEPLKKFANQGQGAMIFLKQVEKPEKYVIATIKGSEVTEIQDKPLSSKSDLAVTGLYLYDNRVWDIIAGLQPSIRGELEISDINNYYSKQNRLNYELLEKNWFDIDTFSILLQANLFIARQKKLV